MKILIAGDSFAAETKSYVFRKYSWSNILQNQTKWSITNIAEEGASLSHTYLKLDKINFEKFDKVVVVVTQIGRVCIQNSELQLANLNAAEDYIKKLSQSTNHMRYKIALAVKYYYEYLYNEDLELVYFESLLKKIKEIVPKQKLVLVNGCCMYEPFNHYYSHPIRLTDISSKELRHLYNPWTSLFSDHQETKMHANHMIQDNKIILAKLIQDLCEYGTSQISIDDFVQMDSKDFSKYWSKKV